MLVRHSNGYVTAYAHASELIVKHGETVKRGQVIAKAGADRHRFKPAIALRSAQGRDPGRSDSVPDRRVIRRTARKSGYRLSDQGRALKPKRP